MISVIQRKTGRLLGNCDIPNFKYLGRRFVVSYTCDGVNFTEAWFRYKLITNSCWNDPAVRLIAFGYRDASLLPNFKRS